MNNKKIVIVIFTSVFFLISVSLILGIFLCSTCFSSEKEEAKVYELIANAKYAQAITTINSIISKTKDPQTKSKYQYLLATCYRMNGDWDKAISNYKPVADQKESWFSEISRLRIAKRYQELNNYVSAIDEYEKLVNDHPKSPCTVEAFYQIAECYHKLKNYDKALESYDEFTKKYSQGSRSRLCAYKVGYMYQEKNQFQEAYDQYQKVIKQHPDSFAGRQALDRAKSILTAYSQIKSSREDNYYMGLVLFYLKQYTKARDELKKAIGETDELSGKTSYFIAQSYQNEANYDLAQKEYESFIKTYPQSEYLLDAKYKIAECVWKAGKIDDAIKLLMKFASDYPQSELADNAELKIADLYKERNLIAKALEAYEKVVEKYPVSDSADDALWNMGWCYIELNDYNKSGQIFQKLISQYPDSDKSSTARFWAGMSYEKTGNYTEAVIAYKQAMENKDWYYSDRAKRRIDLLLKTEKIDQETASYQYKKAEFEEFLPITSIIKESTPIWVNDALNIGIIDDVVDVFKTLEEAEIAIESAYYNLSVCYERMGEYRTSWGYIWRLTRMPNVNTKNGLFPRQFYLRLYPTVYTKLVNDHSKTHNIDPQLVSAVIREESRYDHKAISSAGARGLMQIMPSTGKYIAEKFGEKKFDTDKLFEPENNIKMGSWYLAQLVDSFTTRTKEYFVSRGNPQPEYIYTDIATILALGGYNAGPTRMRRWMDEFGIDDIDIFVEKIPLQEPRHYIKKVLNSYETYKALYSG